MEIIKRYDEFLNEKVQVKRKYTEKYPAVINNNTKIRNSILGEINEDDELEYDDFYQRLLKHTQHPKKWINTNAYYFDDVRGKIRLSKKGREYKKSINTQDCCDTAIVTED